MVAGLRKLTVSHELRHRAGKSNLGSKTQSCVTTLRASTSSGMHILPPFTRPMGAHCNKEVGATAKRKRKSYCHLARTCLVSPLDFHSIMLPKIPIRYSLSARIRASFARNSALVAWSAGGFPKLNFTNVPSRKVNADSASEGRPLAPKTVYSMSATCLISRSGCTGGSAFGETPTEGRAEPACWAGSRPSPASRTATSSRSPRYSGGSP